MKTLRDLWQIAKKDLVEFARDRLRLITFIIMPFFMMIMVGFIFPNQNSLKNIPLGANINDSAEISQQLSNSLSSLKIAGDKNAFQIKTYDSIEAIKEGIKNQEISGGISVPKDFSQKIAQGEQIEITIIEDQSNPQMSQLINQVLTKVVNGFSEQLGVQNISQILVTYNPSETNKQSLITQAQTLIRPIISKIEGIVPGNPNYFEFVAPGIVAMIVMTAVLTGLAASISREKEQGTLDGILISPINRLAIIMGKALAQSIRGIIQGLLVLLLAFLVFGVTVQGNIFLVLLLLFVGIFSFVGLGILVSTIATEQETATQLLFMFQFPMLFLSGVFFPIAMMPSFMQKIAHAIPLTYAIEALRKVMVLGAGLSAVRNELLILLIFGAVTLTISVPIFKKVITR